MHMLVGIDRAARTYHVAINNGTSYAEIMADLSYLAAVPTGVLLFDFTHMTVPLTKARLEMHLPGNLGYQPTQLLIEVVAAIAWCVRNNERSQHRLIARLPNSNTRVGKFLTDMHLQSVLREMRLKVEYADPTVPEVGTDDARSNLIPLALLRIEPESSLVRRVAEIRNQVERVFQEALASDHQQANRFTSIVSEAVDNMIEYGEGGIIGGLYYPRVGEVEITLVNESVGFGGETPDEQLEVLVGVCEGRTQRQVGGGYGFAALSDLALHCFGTLLLRNGNACVRLGPDASMVGTTEVTELPTLGASVTTLLQLSPSCSVERTEAMRAFDMVLNASLQRHLQKRFGA
ncbi:MAG: hypothetical protein ACR2PL_27725 [Dehalococcoidia bacterium]